MEIAASAACPRDAPAEDRVCERTRERAIDFDRLCEDELVDHLLEIADRSPGRQRREAHEGVADRRWIDPDRPRSPMFDGPSTLAAMALETNRIRIGTLVSTFQSTSNPSSSASRQRRRNSGSGRCWY
jgi:alkanesulfonate monooxygenase SsuD/methylene tetrahydromethanopterin reductase-like flavin-dependent oxidoreductase (luciferase family)